MQLYHVFLFVSTKLLVYHDNQACLRLNGGASFLTFFFTCLFNSFVVVVRYKKHRDLRELFLHFNQFKASETLYWILVADGHLRMVSNGQSSNLMVNLIINFKISEIVTINPELLICESRINV